MTAAVGRTHRYEISLTWTGNRGTGTSGYRAYGRSHDVRADGLPPIAGSSDRAFHGDRDRWNPELELTAALSQCHLLSYLHVCASAGVIVTSYTDDARGTMAETGDGGGRFTEVVLRPRVTVSEESMVEAALRLHGEASTKCFIAASVNFPVRHEPVVTVGAAAPSRPPERSISTVPPIRREVLVDAGPQLAFDVFTGDIGRWWPIAELSVYGAGATVTMADEEIVERSPDGHSALWGTIIRWAPPFALAFTWHPGRLPDRASHVEVMFAAIGEQTLVTLIHSGWETFGDPAAAQAEYDRGWPPVLARYAVQVQDPEALTGDQGGD